jgi:deoxyribodipyrimidine photo-lyase
MKRPEDCSRDLRVTTRRGGAADTQGRCVVYWMQRAQRAEDNPALEKAIEVANHLEKPVVVFFRLVPQASEANLRHYTFLVQGLADVARGLERRRVGFVLRRHPEHGFLKFCDEVRPCLVVGDEDPRREAEETKSRVGRGLRVPYWTVDGDVVVPTRLLGKENYAARTIRPRLRLRLKEFLKPPRKVPVQVAWKRFGNIRTLSPADDLLRGFPVNRSVEPVSGFVGGTAEAKRRLRRFVRERLKGYARNRNLPEIDGTSQLSPYLHFGQIGPHTVALAVRDAAAPRRDREAFLEEFIVRRELAVNFVRFNPDYDRLSGCERWALKTLAAHAQDRRPYLYSEADLENGETHDPLWNAAQRQMVSTGWMHGYVRMYWAKKILEWTRSFEEAFEIALRLNDRYELDGRDPSGVTGVAWAIGGKHDRAWGPERPIYGKIRYMSFASTSKKFDSKAYIAKVAKAETEG